MYSTCRCRATAADGTFVLRDVPTQTDARSSSPPLASFFLSSQSYRYYILHVRIMSGAFAPFEARQKLCIRRIRIVEKTKAMHSRFLFFPFPLTFTFFPSIPIWPIRSPFTLRLELALRWRCSDIQSQDPTCKKQTSPFPPTPLWRDVAFPKVVPFSFSDLLPDLFK
ncbi:hypothetical protein ABW19_dt0201482 [Dactylella cylindrospora]|nr:hypothetical protein ABW19_dt0201482 [Dactylella cylindrospora]